MTFEQVKSNFAKLDVLKYTVAMTDMRTGEKSIMELYRPEGMASRGSIAEGIARFGYYIDHVNVEIVTCDIDWERVFGYYNQLKGESYERLELQAVEA